MVSDDEETMDELRSHGLKIMQKRHGYRFSLDPLLLAHFVTAEPAAKVADLGTGSGIIPLLLARKSSEATFVGIEFQEAMAELARRNVALNSLEGRISVHHADVLEVKGLLPVSSFDLVTANPPYRKRGTGRISPKKGRDLARHESTALLADFLQVAKYLVKPAGRIAFIYHPSRLTEFMELAATLKLCPLRLRFVHGTVEAEARMFLVELAKGRGGDLTVLPPLVIYDSHGGYMPEMQFCAG